MVGIKWLAEVGGLVATISDFTVNRNPKNHPKIDFFISETV